MQFSLKEVIKHADFIFSTVTADQALHVAREVSPFLRDKAYFFDLNSCAPFSKQKSCRSIESNGGCYVDVAVMAPVFSKKNLVPLLISGRKAAKASAVLEKLPMNAKVIDGPVGRASSVKMVRSIMVKGLEALTAECTLAAVEAGILDEVFASISDGHPYFDILTHAMYNFERSLSHGKRRAEELEEVSKMLDELMLTNQMSKAAAIWQKKLGSLEKPSFISDIKTEFHSFPKELSTDLGDIKEL